MSLRSNSSMTDLQYKHCIKVTEKIKNFATAEYFLEPVDPTLVPDYYTFIKKPMHLNRVSQKLEAHEYTSLQEWRNDMNLIWENAKKFNRKEEFLYLIAKELQKRFKEMAEIPRTEDEEWIYKMRKIHDKFKKIWQTRPPDSKG